MPGVGVGEGDPVGKFIHVVDGALIQVEAPSAAVVGRVPFNAKPLGRPQKLSGYVIVAVVKDASQRTSLLDQVDVQSPNVVEMTG